jgi:hypothetical protein
VRSERRERAGKPVEGPPGGRDHAGMLPRVQEMVIYGVSFDMVGKQPIVLLKTVDSNKFLPSGSAIRRLPPS